MLGTLGRLRYGLGLGCAVVGLARLVLVGRRGRLVFARALRCGEGNPDSEADGGYSGATVTLTI